MTTMPATPAEDKLRHEALQIARTQPAVKLGTVRQETYRDTFDQIAIALIFAFAFRAFVAEAFIIPTGSMAETLFGRHKDVVCPECHTRFQVGASEEVTRDTNLLIPHNRIRAGYCKNCRYRMDIYDEIPFKGDRILVNKFPFEVREPRRFEVVVFKYPEDASTNYIKRLVGLPGETLTILGGDLYVRKGETASISIQRKPPLVQRELQILVYDNDHPAERLVAQGFPERWGAVQADAFLQADPSGWTTVEGERAFEIDLTKYPEGMPRWIRYRHFLPEPDDWATANDGQPIARHVDPRLVGDFYSYNSGEQSQRPPAFLPDDATGRNWVGDLAVEAEVEVVDPQGTVTFELVEGRRRYHCGLELETGRCTLSFQDESHRGARSGELEDQAIGEVQTSLNKPGKYRILFANADDQLRVWIDDTLQNFSLDGKPVDGTYEMLPQISERVPTYNDLAPVGIAAQKAHVRVGHLQVRRDLYYTKIRAQMPYNLTSPEQYAEGLLREGAESFTLSEDEFFMLGDNSPQSQDSRAWNNRPVHPYAVNRNLLVGKAFLIYWPHAIPVGNDGHGYAPKINMLRGLLYETAVDYDSNGKPVYRPSDYQDNSLLFYPQFERFFKLIR